MIARSQIQYFYYDEFFFLFLLTFFGLNYHNFFGTEPNGDGDKVLLSGNDTEFGAHIIG